MPMAASRQAADILELRLVLLGVNPLIWRRLLVRTDASVADLHYTIQIAMGWEDVHLHRFHVRGRDYGLSRVGGLDFADNAHEVRLGDLGLRRGERFVYEYDMGDLWVHEIRLERVLAAEPRQRYPRCTGGKRAAPPEDCGGPWAYMALRDTLALRDDADEWNAEDDNGRDDDDWTDEWDDLLDADERDLIRQHAGFDPERFRRREVNRALREWFEPRDRVPTTGGTPR